MIKKKVHEIHIILVPSLYTVYLDYSVLARVKDESINCRNDFSTLNREQIKIFDPLLVHHRAKYRYLVDIIQTSK